MSLPGNLRLSGGSGSGGDGGGVMASSFSSGMDQCQQLSAALRLARVDYNGVSHGKLDPRRDICRESQTY